MSCVAIQVNFRPSQIQLWIQLTILQLCASCSVDNHSCMQLYNYKYTQVFSYITQLYVTQCQPRCQLGSQLYTNLQAYPRWLIVHYIALQGVRLAHVCQYLQVFSMCHTAIVVGITAPIYYAEQQTMYLIQLVELFHPSR